MYISNEWLPAGYTYCWIHVLLDTRIIVCYSIRFVVRDYEYDPQVIESDKKEKDKLERDLKRQFVSFIYSNVMFLPSVLQGPLMNWLKVNFSQTFSAWVHLKALRVFTESVLRFGYTNICL